MNKKTKNKYENLTETEKQEIQLKFHADDLSYLASYSYESGLLNESDINDLHQSINKKLKIKDKPWLNTFIILMCSTFIATNVVFIHYQNKQTHSSVNNSIIRETLNSIPAVKEVPSSINTAIPLRTYSTEENFVVSELEKEAEQAEIFEDAEIKDIRSLVVKTPEFSAEEHLNYIPNAPFIYLYNLKIADYSTLYFYNKRGIDIRNNGISAAYSNKEEINESKSSIYSDENYYAHEIISDAMQAFNKKQFANCIELLDLLLEINSDDVNIIFYKGMCSLYLKKHKQAIMYFDLAINNHVNVFLEEAQFYKAIALKFTNKDEAKSALLNIKKQKSFYSERAEEELKQFQ